ncbi:MAG: leucyl aminopeptidase [Gammaproteobacteria bacterium]|nr:leucyl aminopeptidase [Gammaproteobacteria bacterium]
MEYSIETTPIETLPCDCIIIGVYQNQQIAASGLELPSSLQNTINMMCKRGDITGKLGETVLINVLPDTAINRVLAVGLGEAKPLSRKSYRKILSAAANNLKKPYIKSLAIALNGVVLEVNDPQWAVRQVVEIFNDAAYQFTALKAEKEIDCKWQKIMIYSPEAGQAAANQGLKQGMAVADGISFTKALADLPGNICTPTYMAEQALELGKKHKELFVKVLEEADMKELGMGSLLSVSRGSRQPAKLIIIEYQSGKKGDKPVALVGKGLTFDAGGISLKPGAGMDEMKYDMCGGAAVMGTLIAAVKMQLPINIVGLVPASENLPDGDANKPGDIVTSMSGKTIEILNTDAEGRLILCDTMTYAERYKPDVVIDMATLTGACLVALGRVPSGLLGNDDKLCNDLINAGDEACDTVWRLPLWEEYQEQLKSNFADLANIGGKDAGTITAACFLSHFAKNFRWAHLDIAGTAWRSGNNKGATGRPVPLLCQYLINRTANA